MLDRNARQPHPYRHFRHRLLTLCASVLLAACAQQPIAPEDGNADQVPEATLVGVSPPVITPEIEVLERPDLWRELRRSFTLDRHIDDRRVRQELAWFRRHPNYLPNLQPRLEQYLGYIFQRVVDRDLPGEIALLPIVESALDPYAFSPGGAAGLWQFISATGRRFGLQRNWWYDGRRDPVAATEAALDFLEYLNRRLPASGKSNCPGKPALMFQGCWRWRRSSRIRKNTASRCLN
jgi:hypothetical protein